MAYLQPIGQRSGACQRSHEGAVREIEITYEKEIGCRHAHGVLAAIMVVRCGCGPTVCGDQAPGRCILLHRAVASAADRADLGENARHADAACFR